MTFGDTTDLPWLTDGFLFTFLAGGFAYTSKFQVKLPYMVLPCDGDRTYKKSEMKVAERIVGIYWV